MIVAKFGGTSLASASQIKKVCDIITSDPSAGSSSFPRLASATGTISRLRIC